MMHLPNGMTAVLCQMPSMRRMSSAEKTGTFNLYQGNASPMPALDNKMNISMVITSASIIPTCNSKQRMLEKLKSQHAHQTFLDMETPSGH